VEKNPPKMGRMSPEAEPRMKEAEGEIFRARKMQKLGRSFAVSADEIDGQGIMPFYLLTECLASC